MLIGSSVSAVALHGSLVVLLYCRWFSFGPVEPGRLRLRCAECRKARGPDNVETNGQEGGPLWYCYNELEISSGFLKIHGSRSFPGTGYFFMCMRRDRCKTFVCVCEHAAAKSSLLTKQWSHRFYLFFLCLTGLVMSCAGERERERE